MDIPESSKHLISLLNTFRNPYVGYEESRTFAKVYKELYGKEPELLLVPMAQDASNFVRAGMVLPMLTDLATSWVQSGNLRADPANAYMRVNCYRWNKPATLARELNWGTIFIYSRSEFEEIMDSEEATPGPTLVGWATTHVFSVGSQNRITFGPVILHPELGTLETYEEVIDCLLAMTTIVAHDMKLKRLFDWVGIDVPVLTEGTEIDSSGTHLRAAGPTKSKLLGDGLIANTYLAKMLSNHVARNRFDKEFNPLHLTMREMKPVDCLALPEEFLVCMGDMEEHFRKEIDALEKNKSEKPATKEQRIQIGRETILSSLFSADEHYLVVTDSTSKPVGLVFYTASKNKPIHLDFIYVVEEERGKGYGTWMLQNFFQEVFLLPESIPLITLTTIGENNKLLQFYFQNGFFPYSLKLAFRANQSKELTNVVVS